MDYPSDTDSKDGVPVEIKRQEGKALHKLWASRKKRTQAAFMDSLGYSAGYFPQFFSGQRPLTIKLALAAAEELDVEVSDFSPRLAAHMGKALEATGWPFKRFTREDYQSLTKAQKEAVEAFVVAFLPEVKAPSGRKLRSV